MNVRLAFGVGWLMVVVGGFCAGEGAGVCGWGECGDSLLWGMWIFSRLEKTLHVRAAINGGPVGEFTVDTGSVGGDCGGG